MSSRIDEIEKRPEFAAYNQAIEDAKAAIRGEKVDDPYAAATFINVIARKCSPHVYVNRIATAPTATSHDCAYADGYADGFRHGRQSKQVRETCPRCAGSGFETDGITSCDQCGGRGLVSAAAGPDTAVPTDLIAFRWAESLSTSEQEALLGGSLRRLQDTINSATAPTETSERCGECDSCHHSNVNNNGTCVESVLSSDGLHVEICGCKCIPPLLVVAQPVQNENSGPPHCPACGRALTSDFDPDTGMWYECKSCDLRWAVSSAPAAAAQPRHCNFCRKTECEVSTLIDANVGYICNECVKICADIIKRHEPSTTAAVEAAKEIQDWNQYGEGEGSYEADVAYIAAIISKHFPVVEPPATEQIEDLIRHCAIGYPRYGQVTVNYDMLVEKLTDHVEHLHDLAYLPKILPDDEVVTYRDHAESLLRRNLTARADAIGECVEVVAESLRALRENFIPVNRALEVSATALEQLKGEGGGSK